MCGCQRLLGAETLRHHPHQTLRVILALTLLPVLDLVDDISWLLARQPGKVDAHAHALRTMTGNTGGYLLVPVAVQHQFFAKSEIRILAIGPGGHLQVLIGIVGQRVAGILIGQGLGDGLHDRVLPLSGLEVLDLPEKIFRIQSRQSRKAGLILACAMLAVTGRAGLQAIASLQDDLPAAFRIAGRLGQGGVCECHGAKQAEGKGRYPFHGWTPGDGRLSEEFT